MTEKWYLENGEYNDTVFSVRVRLARNFDKIPFPGKMTDEQKYSVIQQVSDAVLKSDIGAEFEFIDMDKISEIDAYSLVERHIISPEFAQNTKGRALLLKKDESLSVMINEEDHIRIQSIASGLQFKKAYEKALEIERIIGKNIKYAFDSKFGYLTECPTNLGTGMRASAMLHLPALESIGAINKMFGYISKMGVAVRGTFGEGSKAKSSMYQISNQITLGVTEPDSIENVDGIVKQLVGKELEAREAFDRDRLEDAVYRAYGTLKYARMISSKEFFDLISKLRLGAGMKMIDTPLSVINDLTLNCQAATVQKKAGGKLDSETRDKTRARYIREKLKI